ncbi:50S ribosomal protein L7/L12 [candidate division TA06 bacterium DG_26]|uniref:Large ribosomal subunit protein bL12 n=1 Tax=candidate division TA06 bacterium DG_26 TaxID=1703771 RepID=A0A0S7WNY4_UNCT6|nr:MAG: 50S ribosomal protein L7/L12 [candidate division TA06 bacterium DG_26]
MPTKTKKSNKEVALEAIEKMSVLELSELVKDLEEKFGVSAQVVSTVQAPTASAAAEPKVEEKTEFDVILQSVGEKKIQVIKEVRAVTGLGLKEAKEFCESAPKPIKTAITKEEAEKLKEKLESIGAKVEIK